MQDDKQPQEVVGEPVMPATMQVPAVEPLSPIESVPSPDLRPTIPSSQAVDLARVEQTSIEETNPVQQQITALNAAPDSAVHNESPVLVADAQAHIVPIEGKSHKKLFISIALLVVVLLGFGGGWFYYWNEVRIPDSEYASAATTIDRLEADSKQIHTDLSGWGLLDQDAKTTVTTASVVRTVADTNTDSSASDATRYAAELKKAQDAEQKLKDYAATLNSLRSMRAIQKDSTVQKAFTAKSKALAAYQSDFSAIAMTESTLLGFLDVCSTKLNLDNVTDTASYDMATKGCLNFVRDNSTVPIKAVNDIYVPMMTDIKGLLDALHNYLDAFATNNEVEYTTAMAAMEKYEKAIDKDDAGSNAFSSQSTEPTSPAQSLSDLKTTLQNRQKVFLR